MLPLPQVYTFPLFSLSTHTVRQHDSAHLALKQMHTCMDFKCMHYTHGSIISTTNSSRQIKNCGHNCNIPLGHSALVRTFIYCDVHQCFSAWQATEVAGKSLKEAAARHFRVDPRRIREWCTQNKLLELIIVVLRFYWQFCTKKSRPNSFINVMAPGYTRLPMCANAMCAK